MDKRIAWWAGGIALWCSVVWLSGCSSADFAVGISRLDYNLAGSFVSEDPVGELGRLSLELTQREDTVVFEAALSAEGSDELGYSEGIGTVGNGHLVLNFDRNLETDYYFEGTVEVTGDEATAINGNLVFPDLANPLPVRFIR